MEKVYYWYDGNVPYCTNVTAWQPIDDNYVHMNVPAYSYIDNSHGQQHTSHQVNCTTCWRVTCTPWADFVPGQVVNIRRGHVGYQEGLYHVDLYTPQRWELSYSNAHNCTYNLNQFGAPPPPPPRISIAAHGTSNLSSESSLSSWNNLAQAPPAQHPQQQHSHSHSDDANLGLRLATPYDSSHDSTPYVSQVASSVVYSQHPQEQQQSSVEARVPSTPPSVPPSPASELGTQDLVGPRAPKLPRVTRSVQPLACFFCRGRKIACGPPTSTRSGNQTCEYVVTRHLTFSILCFSHYTATHILTLFFLFGMDRSCARRHLICEYPAESYRGRRAAGPKGASVRPQQR